MATRYSVRLATIADAIFLREMVYEAASPPLGAKPDERPSREEMLTNPRVAAFVDGWGRPGDHGVVAECELEPVGAGWFRIFDEDDPEGGFVGGQTPELLIAIVPEHRGKGVGGLILGALVEKARDEHMPSVGLNVAKANFPAAALFRRFGFQTRRDVGGVLTMQLPLR